MISSAYVCDIHVRVGGRRLAVDVPPMDAAVCGEGWPSGPYITLYSGVLVVGLEGCGGASTQGTGDKLSA